MIKYRLQCANGHEFDAWFASSDSFDAQAAESHIACPGCDSHEVGKSVMAPSLFRHVRNHDDEAPGRYRNLIREAARAHGAGSEDVGDRFAEEARRIHYREAEQRTIRGTASPDEAQALLDEGVEIVALPRLPQDVN